MTYSSRGKNVNNLAEADFKGARGNPCMGVLGHYLEKKRKDVLLARADFD
jgi:hypothetical protein